MPTEAAPSLTGTEKHKEYVFGEQKEKAALILGITPLFFGC